jgi:hypothetical protein
MSNFIFIIMLLLLATNIFIILKRKDIFDEWKVYIISLTTISAAYSFFELYDLLINKLLEDNGQSIYSVTFVTFVAIFMVIAFLNKLNPIGWGFIGFVIALIFFSTDDFYRTTDHLMNIQSLLCISIPIIIMFLNNTKKKNSKVNYINIDGTYIWMGLGVILSILGIGIVFYSISYSNSHSNMVYTDNSQNSKILLGMVPLIYGVIMFFYSLSVLNRNKKVEKKSDNHTFKNDSHIMFCKQCGTKLSDDSKFCITCGCKVNE